MPIPPPNPSARKWHAGAVALAVLALAYPFVVYFSLGRVEPRWLAVLMLMLATLRLFVRRDAMTWGFASVALCVFAMSWVADGWLPVKLYPVLLSLVLLALFGGSLLRPPTVIERIARLAEPGLPAEAIAYTRQVTRVWCIFFVVNASLSLATTVWGSDATWALYNGLVSYLLMGALMAAELLTRKRFRAQLAARHVTGE